MRINQFVFSFFFYLFAALSTNASEINPRVTFDKYSINNGLSHVGVSTFYQDSKGFLWIGTYDGLNRFDGINFKVFKHIPDDSTSLINNRVRCILEHSSGNLLIGTEGGICIYDSEKGIFRKFEFDIPENNSLTIFKMFEDSSKRLWILTNNHVVYVIDFLKHDLKSLFIVPNNNSTGTFNDIIEDKHGYIWLASSNGLLCYKKDLQFVTLDIPSFLVSSNIRCVELDLKNDLWVSHGSVVNQFSCVYIKDKIMVQPKNVYKFKSNVLTLLEDRKGSLWIGTFNDGIFRISTSENNDKKNIENYTNKPFIPKSVSSNWIVNIYEDKHGNIWFGTGEKGVNKYSYDKALFVNVDQSMGLKSNYVLDLIEYNSEKLICGTRNGISVFNYKTEKIEKAWFDDSLFNNLYIAALYKDQDGFLWFGTTNGFFYLPPRLKGKPQRLFISDQNTLGNILCISEDKRRNLWIGTTNGVFRIDFENKPLSYSVLNFNTRKDQRISNTKVSYIYVDPKDMSIWIGTWYNGLFHITQTGNEKNVNDFKIFNHRFVHGKPTTLRSNFVTAIHRSKTGNLWIGTEGGGLSMLQDKNGNGSFIHYTEKEGLSNNVVKSILEADDGKLYIGTNDKLNVFNPKSKTFKYYDVKDGIKSSYFNEASLQLSNKLMVLGGNDGFTLFDTQKIDTTNTIPTPEFGDFQLFYKVVHPGENINGKIFLPKSLSYMKEIRLKYFQNTFSIELLGVSFDKPEDNYFKYRLINYDKEWISTKPVNNIATYSNVEPGEYVFEFNVSNNKNDWSTTPKQIKIIISPPFWKTWWAYSLYVVLIAGVIIAVFYFLMNMERLKNNLRIEQLEKEKEKEINDIKLRFFTNISHEFKTPVSLILGPVENLMTKFKENDSVKNNLLLIYKQANYLLRLLDQLLEFRKVEKESMKLNCVENDIVPFVKNIVKGFNSKSIEQKINYNLYFSDESLNVWFDPQKIEIVVYNLLSNAFKFTPSGGTITVRLERESNYVIISVEDDGPGIPKDELTLIFDRFYQSKSTPNLHGTGIGLTLSKSLTELHHGNLLVSSELGSGTCFTLKLPLGNSHLTNDELSLLKSDKHDIETYEDDNISNNMLTSKNELFVNTKEHRHLPVLLLVEDNFQMRKFLEDILSEYYQVLSADNGNDGFKIACNKAPEIIISDVMMPGINGVELVKKLKNELITSHIPIILLTAKKDLDYYIEGIETGADDYISKPFHIQQLLVRIKNLLDNRARLRIRYSKYPDKNDVLNEEQFSDRDNEFIHNLYEIAEQNLDNPDFSADNMSRLVFMSRTNFYKKLKALMNQTPGEFLRIYRIKRAGEFLSTGQYSVSQVTNMVGFKSRSHFYQCFKAYYGYLPTDSHNKRI